MGFYCVLLIVAEVIQSCGICDDIFVINITITVIIGIIMFVVINLIVFIIISVVVDRFPL